MSGRKFSTANAYRFGFNGKENNNEVKGDGNSVDFGARVYDSRIGKWLSVDPFEIKYPANSPYSHALGNPIFNIDHGGKFVIPYGKDTKEYKAAISFINRIRTEVQSWTQADPKWQAFQSLTGTATKADLLNILEDGNGPDFLWGDGATTNSDGSHLMRGNGQGFDEKSSYGLTSGVSSITFDAGLKDITLKVDEEAANLAKNGAGLGAEMSLKNSFGNIVVKGGSNIQKQLDNANDFLLANGLHELTHSEYNRNGTKAVLKADNSDYVLIPNTPVNERAFGVGIFNSSTCGPVNMERGDAMERSLFGKLFQYTNSGVIPLMIYNQKTLACHTGDGSATRNCFQNQADQTKAKAATTQQQQQATAAEPGVINL